MMEQSTMYMGIEVSARKWKFCFWSGSKKREKNVDAGDQLTTLNEIEAAKNKLNLPADCKVRSCYEAGRDAFWIHRFLEKNGIENVVVDPASIEVNRRKRRAKNDRLDAKKLVEMLYRYWELKETKVWKVVQVPSEQDEDDRELHRHMQQLQTDCQRFTNRIKATLCKFGITVNNVRDCDLTRLRDWENKPLPGDTSRLLRMEQQRLRETTEHFRALQQVRRERLAEPRNESDRKAVKLKKLRSVGAVGAWTLTKEFLGWRQFNNREEVGALAGLTGTPYESGDASKDQGISKAGNPRVRSLMIELAWSWVHYQPDSTLSQWFMDRFGYGNKRMRRVGIVALARKLLVALWKYTEFDQIPEGARLSNN